MSKEAEDAFSKMKKEIENSVVAHVDDSKPFVLETDASDETVGATLLLSGWPVDFFFRGLNEVLKQSSLQIKKRPCPLLNQPDIGGIF